jgi:hypothetical protein
MMDGLSRIPRFEPSEAIDVRVKRRMLEVVVAERSRRDAAPFLPFERTVYAVVAVAYAVYTAANAIQLFHGA